MAEAIGSHWSYFGNMWADLALACVFAVLLPASRWALTKVLFKPLGTYYLVPVVKKEEGGPSLESRLDKWSESAWKTTIYTVLSALTLWAAIGEPWFTDPKEYWSECMRIPCVYPVTFKISLAYAVEAGHYIYSIPALLVWEARRKDFLASLAHHIVTLGLVVYSYAVNFTRVGIVILFLHDVCDIWLEIAKLCRYARKMNAANAWFAFFALVWFVMRVFYFPLYPIYSCLVYAKEEADARGVNASPHYEIFNGGLIFLWILHIYWSYLIVRVIINALSSDGVHDEREDDED